MMKKLHLVFTAILITTASLFAQIPGYVPTTDLQGWWEFTGNGNDASSSGNNLTNNGAVLVADRFGNSNSAYSFDGINQYLTNATPSFSFSSTSSFTVSFWMLKTNNSYGVAIMNSTGTGGNFVWNFQTTSTGLVQFGTNRQGTAWNWAQTTHALNQWDHYLATYNGSAMTFYINGLQVATSTYLNTAAAQATLPFWVGRSHAGNYFSGSLDDIGIWTRVLTSTEIDALYNGCQVSLTHQPSNVAAAMGTAATFGVATADTAVTFQWQQNTGSGFQNLTNGGQFSGVNSDTLLVSNLLITNDGDQFRCFIEENATCTDTSIAVTLNVCGAINTQPSSKSVPLNTATYFATGSTDPSATYQWQLATTGVFGDLYNGAIFTGVTTDTLKLTSTSAINNNQRFRCIVVSGQCTDTTSEAILTVVNIGLDEEFLAQVKLYPNPANGILNLEMPQKLEEISYAIFNSLGQPVLSGQLIEEKTTIDVSQLATGLYTIRFGNSVAKSFSIVR